MATHSNHCKTDSQLSILRYSDLTALGYGSRATIWRSVRAGTFEEPIEVHGRPAWTPEMLRRSHQKNRSAT